MNGKRDARKKWEESETRKSGKEREEMAILFAARRYFSRHCLAGEAASTFVVRWLLFLPLIHADCSARCYLQWRRVCAFHSLERVPRRLAKRKMKKRQFYSKSEADSPCLLRNIIKKWEINQARISTNNKIQLMANNEQKKHFLKIKLKKNFFLLVTG